MFSSKPVGEVEHRLYVYRITHLKNKMLAHPQVKGSVYPWRSDTFLEYHTSHPAESLFPVMSRLADACVMLTTGHAALHMFHSHPIPADVLGLHKKLSTGVVAPSYFLYRIGSRAIYMYNDRLITAETTDPPFGCCRPLSPTRLCLCHTQLIWTRDPLRFASHVQETWYMFITPVSGLHLCDTQIQLEVSTILTFRVNEAKIKLFLSDEGDVYALLVGDPPFEVVFAFLSLLVIWVHKTHSGCFRERGDPHPAAALAAEWTGCDDSTDAFLHLVRRQGTVQKFPPLPVEPFLERVLRLLPTPRPHQARALQFLRSAPPTRRVFALAQFCCWLDLYRFAFTYQGKIYYSPEFADEHDTLFIFCVNEDFLFSFIQVEQALPHKLSISTDHIFQHGKRLDCFWPLQLNAENIGQLLDTGEFDHLTQYVDAPTQPGAITQFIDYQQMLMVADRPLISSPYVKIKPLAQAVFPVPVVSLHTLYTDINLIHRIKRMNLIAVYQFREDAYFVKLSLGGMTQVSFYLPVDVAQCQKELTIYYHPQPDPSAIKAMAAYDITQRAFRVSRQEPELVYSGAEQTLAAKATFDYAKQLMPLSISRSSGSLPPVRYTFDDIVLRHDSEAYALSQLRPPLKKMKKLPSRDLQQLVSAYKMETDAQPNVLHTRDFYIKSLIYGSPFTYFTST